MKRLTIMLALLTLAAFLSACGGAATNSAAITANANTNSNTNSNTAKPVAAAPTTDALLALDKAATEAYAKGDGTFFDGFLDAKFVMYEGGQHLGKADVVKMISGVKCEVKDAFKLEEAQMAMINADTYALTYKSTGDGTCSEGGKSEKIPSPVRAASIYIRNGDKWSAVFHGENLIIDPKNPPKAPPAPAKKEVTKKDDKTATNSNANAAPAAAKPAPDANTDALVKIHTSGWEAFKAKDAKKFDELLTASFVNVDPIGSVVSGKAAAIKNWTETMKCEGITKVSVTDGFGTAISPTVELFTLKGTADGTCEGQKNGPLYQSTIYVKEGDAWKLAFMFESAGM